MKTPEEIGKLVRELRGELSLRSFGDKCGLSHSTIDYIEKGYDFRTKKPANTSVTVLNQIAVACNVPLSYFLDDDSSNSKNEELKLAIFGGSDATDEMLDKVLEYAQFLKNQNSKGEN